MKKNHSFIVLTAGIILAVLMMTAPAFAEEETDSQIQAAAGQMYTLNAQPVDLQTMPGVYQVQARVGDSMKKHTIGIPSVAKQTLADQPTQEMPAIIMGAAVNYEVKTGPTTYAPIPGKQLVAPYSYFRWNVTREERKEADGTISVHDKLSGFDGTFYLIRVDVSQLIEDMGEGKFLHVKQESNTALMAASGMEGNTFSDALGSKTGSYSLADNAAALKDSGAYDLDQDTPYLDVIVMSSGKLVAGADAGKKNAPSADIKLQFYVDDQEKYNDLQMLDPANMPTFPYTVNDPIAGKMTFKTENDYTAALLNKFYKNANATKKNRASSYLVKGSDLEIDSAIDETDTLGKKSTNPDTRTVGRNWMAEPDDFWSMEEAIAHQEYDDHTVILICEVPVLKGMYIGSAEGQRSVILDVNSFDIQVANNTKLNKPGLTIDNGAILRIKDGTNTSGAELAIGNNANMLIKDGGTMIIDDTCTCEVEYDAGTTTKPNKKKTKKVAANPNKDLLNGEITIESGGTLINYGVLNIEGKEFKPLDPGDTDQTVLTDQKAADLVIDHGGTLENFGCISLKGALYVMGVLNNFGKYENTIDSGDPDKGITQYHEGIQVTWKDDVTREGAEPGVLNIGIDAAGTIDPRADLSNDGDIVLCPGTCNLYGDFINDNIDDKDVGHVYLCTADEAIIPITPTQEDPMTVEKRVTLDPPRLSEFNNDGEVLNEGGYFHKAKVALIHNGVLGELTTIGEPIDPPAKSVTAPGTEHVTGGSTVKVIVDFRGATTALSTGTAAITKGKNAKTVTVPAKVTIKGRNFAIVGIDAGAFQGTKAKTLVMKTKALTKKSVKGSLKGSKVRMIQVRVGSKKLNKKYVKKYKKIFTKKNAGRKVKVR